jgi:hypothetical protein
MESHEKQGQLINYWDLYHNLMRMYLMATERGGISELFAT